MFKVCNLFNDDFINAASDIGKEDPIQYNEGIDDILRSYEDHTIIRRIKTNVPHTSSFIFSLLLTEECW